MAREYKSLRDTETWTRLYRAKTNTARTSSRMSFSEEEPHPSVILSRRRKAEISSGLRTDRRWHVGKSNGTGRSWTEAASRMLKFYVDSFGIASK